MVVGEKGKRLLHHLKGSGRGEGESEGGRREVESEGGRGEGNCSVDTTDQAHH